MLDIALLLALLLAILLLGAAGIGGGIYVIRSSNQAVDTTCSRGWRATSAWVLRFAGAVMVGVGLTVLYLAYWTVTSVPTGR